MRAMLFVFACALLCAQTAVRTATPLAGGAAPIHRAIVQGDSHHYSLAVPAGQAARVSIEQQGVDLAGSFRCGSDPELTVDADESGPELLTIIAAQPRTCAITVHAPRTNTGDGSYSIQAALHPVESSDQLRLEAALLTTRVRKLRVAGGSAALDQAMPLVVTAREKWHAAGEPASEVRCVILQGDLHLDRSDRATAVKFYAAAAQLARDAGERAALAEALVNLGLCQWKLALHEEARASMTESTDLLAALGSPHYALALQNLGLLYWQTGDYSRALEFLRQSLDLLRRRNHPLGAASALHNLALTHLALGRPEQALAELREVAALRGRLGQPVDQARTENMAAATLLSLGRPREAEPLLAHAQAAVAHSLDRDLICDIQVNAGRLNLDLGNPERAAELFTAAAAMAHEIQATRMEAFATHFLGMARARQGRFDEARTLLLRTRELRLNNGSSEIASESLFEAALIAARQGDTEYAVATLETVIGESESVRNRVTSEYFRSTYFARKQPYYDAYIALLMRLGRAERAFEIVERARARSLMDLLGAQPGGFLHGADPALAAEQGSLFRAVQFKANQIKRTPGSAQLRAELDELISRYRSLEGRLTNAAVRRNAFAGYQPLSAQALRELLESGETLLEFRLGAEHSYLWTVTHDAVTATVLPPKLAIESRVRAFTALAVDAAGRAASPARQRRFAQLRESLSAELFAPLRGMLAGRRIRIVPDGALHRLPFAMLLAGVTELEILPSASVLARRAPANPPASGILLAIAADPVYEAGDPRFRKLGLPAPRRTPSETLTRLPFSGEEAGAAVRAVRPRPAISSTGFDASKQWLARPEVRNARILHFATHALLDEREPSLNRIVLSKFDRRGRAIDGDLHAFEIQRTDLAASLVVLSGCRTGSGPELRGEGVLSLSQAFLQAGVPFVLMNLWETDDNHSVELMRSFYKHLSAADFRRPSAALAAAQAELRRKGVDPFFWAGFQLVASAR